MSDVTFKWRSRATRRAFSHAKRLTRFAVDAVAQYRPSSLGVARVNAASRNALNAAFAGLQKSPGTPFGKVLVDASWENPNYWYRYCLLRAALGIRQSDEAAFIGPNQRQAARATLSALGIHNVLDFEACRCAQTGAVRSATTLLRSVDSPADIIKWQLPSDLPGSLVYDGILKRQRSPTVDLSDPLLIDYVTEAIQGVGAAEAILDAARPELVVLSHAIEFRYGAMAWCALKRGIPVVVAFGNYGSPRYSRMTSCADFYESIDRPTRAQIDGLSPAATDALASRGVTYLSRRMSGQTDDLGGQFAFGKSQSTIDRVSICKAFGWDMEKPIVAVYASNWFDYPHTFGMSNYVDFLDWLQLTIGAAKRQTNCNWLFRAHPCDQWYGGVTLSDLMMDAPASHLRISPIDWNGAHVQAAMDGLVTVHGTAGIEYAAMGKPVLVADRGWYHDWSFVTHAVSREAYLSHLADLSWLQRSTPDTVRAAAVFAGIYFPLPSHHNIPLGDDSEQNRLVPGLLRLLDEHPQFVQCEKEAIGRWWAAGQPHFHAWRAQSCLAEAEELS